MEKREGSKLENIKSIYIINKILSFLIDSDKLEIIKYNINLQKNLVININHYIKKSGKYIIGDRNRIAKEYDLKTNKLLFEGEYLNGKKIKGKGYAFKNSSKEIFILNDGKGKEYYFWGKLQFEGDYFNGLRWNGKGYNLEGKE